MCPSIGMYDESSNKYFSAWGKNKSKVQPTCQSIRDCLKNHGTHSETSKKFLGSARMLGQSITVWLMNHETHSAACQHTYVVGTVFIIPSLSCS